MVRWGGPRMGGVATHDPSAWAARLWAFLLAFLYGLLDFARYLHQCFAVTSMIYSRSKFR